MDNSDVKFYCTNTPQPLPTNIFIADLARHRLECPYFFDRVSNSSISSLLRISEFKNQQKPIQDILNIVKNGNNGSKSAIEYILGIIGKVS